jgi:trans-2,3-dihydro-3-hydroxyanthranilate isomerase
MSRNIRETGDSDEPLTSARVFPFVINGYIYQKDLLMEFTYYTCDVFTRTPFGGNPLAVIPDADGLSAMQMQQIAREFNYSETTFVLPVEASGTHRVRIFTPATEVPFAGHPNVGTACTLYAHGLVPSDTTVLRFEEQAGLVPVTVRRDGVRGDEGSVFCELRAPEPLTLGTEADVALVARAVGLEADEIVTRTHAPRVASVGLPFLMVEVDDRETLGRAVPNIDAMRMLLAAGVTPDVHVYTRRAGDFDIQARMFAPLDGVLEDPATGSANCALVGLLTQIEAAGGSTDATGASETGERHFRISQGSEMGRPSELFARTVPNTSSSAASNPAVYIGGYSVAMRSGRFEI